MPSEILRPAHSTGTRLPKPPLSVNIVEEVLRAQPAPKNIFQRLLGSVTPEPKASDWDTKRAIPHERTGLLEKLDIVTVQLMEIAPEEFEQTDDFWINFQLGSKRGMPYDIKAHYWPSEYRAAHVYMARSSTYEPAEIASGHLQPQEFSVWHPDLRTTRFDAYEGTPDNKIKVVENVAYIKSVAEDIRLPEHLL